MDYINNIIASIFAIILGQTANHLCKKLPDWVEEKTTFKQFIDSLKRDFKIDILYTVIFIILFNCLIIFQVSTHNYIAYLYMLCIFSLTIIFNIDYRYQLIPDECHYIVVLCGAINMLCNITNWSDYLLGALVGGGSFYLLGLLAIVIYKKEGMGFGDVKLMASLGLLFGLKNILVITILSFAIGAIISIILIFFRKKQMDSYIPFGPFIVMATILVMFFKTDIFIEVYFAICSKIGMFFTDIIFRVIK